MFLGFESPQISQAAFGPVGPVKSIRLARLTGQGAQTVELGAERTVIEQSTGVLKTFHGRQFCNDALAVGILTGASEFAGAVRDRAQTPLLRLVSPSASPFLDRIGGGHNA